MRYYVQVPEVHISTVEIEADSPEQALGRVRDGEGKEVNLEYLGTLDTTPYQDWRVEEKP